MAWLEFTIETTPQSIDSAVTALSARGFPIWSSKTSRNSKRF